MRDDQATIISNHQVNDNLIITLDTIGKNIAPFGDKPIIITCDEVSLAVTGWAVDKRVKKPVENIYVCLDGVTYKVDKPISRLDVVEHLMSPRYRHCGFAIEIPLKEISFGWHILSITVLGRDGGLIQGLSPIWIYRQDKQRSVGQLIAYEIQQFLTRPVQTFQRIRAASDYILHRGFKSFWNAYLNRMHRSSDSVAQVLEQDVSLEKKEDILLTVDLVGKTLASTADQPILVNSHEKLLLVSGWAINRQANGPFKQVYLCLDDNSYLANYGIGRWDVAKHFNNPAYIASGFRIEIPLEQVAPGRHLISVSVIGEDGVKRQGLSQIMIFKEGHQRGLVQLLSFEYHRFKTNPSKFLQRARAASKHILFRGPKSFMDYYLNRMYRSTDNAQKYQQWIVQNEMPERLNEQRHMRHQMEPLISIIVPVYETPEAMLTAMIRSVLDQSYQRFELCIADGASQSGRIRKVLKNFENQDARIKVAYLSDNKGIAGNTNEAIAIATGDFIAMLDHDDLLAPDALFEMVKAINENEDVDVLYSDEDNISSDGKSRLFPYFKPDFSPDTLRTGNYISHLLVVRKSLGDQLGWFRSEFDGAQDYDLILRATEKARKVLHVPKILYHWRAHDGSTALGFKAKPYAEDAGKRALAQHLKRLGLFGVIEDGVGRYIYKINYSLNTQPLVSIIVPNKDQADVLECCIRSILDKSTYKNFEIIIIENKSQENKIFALYKRLGQDPRVKVIPWKKPFNFSALNNFAVKSTQGEVLLFLNNDTEVINADWIERMLEYAIRPNVGVVGAKLYYPDKTIQHGGVIIGLGGVAGHVMKYHVGTHEEFARLNRVQNYSAVTAACMMMKRKVFEEVGGFNEVLAIAFNDVDLCLKVREKGYLIVWTPYAELFHHESKSRGYDNTSDKMARFAREIDTFKQRWGDFLIKGDPYYNPNLTLDTEDFSLKGV